MTTLAGWLERAAAELARAVIEEPRREARLLAAHALGLTAEDLLRRRDAEIGAESGGEALMRDAARRAARVPMAHITGRAGFWDFTVAVSPDTLIPRADTEALIEAALAARPDRASVRRVLDLGTGTGCLLLAALREYPDAWGLGVDIAPRAAALAARNAAALGLERRAGFAASDWAGCVAGRFDLVLSNPPYIPRGDIAGLEPEVRAHEPARALDGGQDGLEAYRLIVALLPRLLAPGAIAVLELGVGQAGPVSGLVREMGLAVAGLRADLSGIGRALVVAAG